MLFPANSLCLFLVIDLILGHPCGTSESELVESRMPWEAGSMMMGFGEGGKEPLSSLWGSSRDDRMMRSLVDDFS